MNHSIGISDSYYRATEKEVLEDYLKAIELLSIQGNEKKLMKQLQELHDRSKDNDYVIKGKLEEKDKQIEELIIKQDKFEHLIHSLIDSGQLRPASHDQH